jgi:glycosyltransferase involved in cell wall biosynthesis
MPALSVLVPVRDARPWLEASFASLWRQRERDFEVIAVDDGSRDGSGEWLERAARSEPRLRVVHTAARGLPQALNTALAHARGRWIARHDADDLSHRDRFARQRAALDAAPGLAAIGCRVRLFPSAAVTAGMRRWAMWHNALLTHEQIAPEALIDSPLAHGSAMLRRRALERVGGWRDRPWAEDVDLWLRLLASGARFAKLPHTLYAWRQHATSATRTDPRYGRDRYLALRLAALERGLLRRAGSLTLVGVGESLASWRRAFAGGPRTVRAVEARSLRDLPLADRPLVLVFGAFAAREARRRVLIEHGLHEGRDFVFVA